MLQTARFMLCWAKTALATHKNTKQHTESDVKPRPSIQCFLLKARTIRTHPDPTVAAAYGTARQIGSLYVVLVVISLTIKDELHMVEACYGHDCGKNTINGIRYKKFQEIKISRQNLLITFPRRERHRVGGSIGFNVRASRRRDCNSTLNDRGRL